MTNYYKWYLKEGIERELNIMSALLISYEHNDNINSIDDFMSRLTDTILHDIMDLADDTPIERHYNTHGTLKHLYIAFADDSKTMKCYSYIDGQTEIIIDNITEYINNIKL